MDEADRLNTTLYSDILQYLTDELPVEDVQRLISIFQVNPPKYGRRLLQDVHSIGGLMNLMSRRGDISESKADFTTLINGLRIAGFVESVNNIREIIANRKSKATHRSACPTDYVLSDNGGGRSSSTLNSPGSSQHYPFTSNQHGLVAIINNFVDSDINKEQKNFRLRRGTIHDENRIRWLFGQHPFSRHYHVDPEYHDLTRDGLENYLQDLASRLQRDCYNSFFLFLMSHGTKKGLEVAKNSRSESDVEEREFVTWEYILNRFHKCLPGRPKVIVIQTCLGGAANRTYTDGPSGSDVDMELEEDDNIALTPLLGADILTAYSTIEGFESYRNSASGSWYIQTMIDELEERILIRKESEHLTDLLTSVQCKVSAIKKSKQLKPTESSGNKSADPNNNVTEAKYVNVCQMPQYVSTLRKKFYLLPSNV